MVISLRTVATDTTASRASRNRLRSWAVTSGRLRSTGNTGGTILASARSRFASLSPLA